MFKKILVPLDGSELAECALGYAEELALMSKAENVTLISVTEKLKGIVFSDESHEELSASSNLGLGEVSSPSNSSAFSNINAPFAIPTYTPKNPDPGSVAVEIGKLEKQAGRYLNRIADRFEKKQIPVFTEVLIGKVAEEIIRYAQEGGYDVIVMSSHGRSGPSRWTNGSITDKVFRSVCIPLLVVRAPGCFPELENRPVKKKK